ncbi:hypothetical protein ACH5RR_013389 [Cinchona calisaya]|uniref:Uncharacterized protein n=1 Tax=Cinchona calisaya TaxID=153742 RepID=A0ABD3A3J2_9GENT
MDYIACRRQSLYTRRVYIWEAPGKVYIKETLEKVNMKGAYQRGKPNRGEVLAQKKAEIAKKKKSKAETMHRESFLSFQNRDRSNDHKVPKFRVVVKGTGPAISACMYCNTLVDLPSP